MNSIDRIYISFSNKISRKIEFSPRLLRLYRWFCFTFLRPRNLTQTPIFINNRNHYTYLKELVEWLDKNKLTNYFVIDNDSSYPPLLDYYKNELKGRVIFLHRNCGHMAIWKADLLTRVKNSFYIYTDADVLPVIQSNPRFVNDLYSAFKKHGFALKAGSAIRIDDLPDCFSLKSRVMEHEKQFWENPLEENIYQAHVDTTLALYLPNYYWDSGHWNRHLRVSGGCLIQHQPWYQNSAQLSAEQIYYKDHAATVTHWTSLTAVPK